MNSHSLAITIPTSKETLNIMWSCIFSFPRTWKSLGLGSLQWRASWFLLAPYKVAHIWFMCLAYVCHALLLPSVATSPPSAITLAFPVPGCYLSLLDVGQLPFFSALSSHHLSPKKTPGDKYKIFMWPSESLFH